MELIPVTLQSQPFWLTLEKCLPEDANIVSDGGDGAIISVSSLASFRVTHRNLRNSFDFETPLGHLADWLARCGELRCTIRVSVGSGSSQPPTVTDHELRLRLTSPSGFPPPTSPAEIFKFKLDHNTAPAKRKDDLPFISFGELDTYVEHVLDTTAALLIRPDGNSAQKQDELPRHVAEILQDYVGNTRELPAALDPALRLSMAAKLLQVHRAAVCTTLKEFEIKDEQYEVYSGRVQIAYSYDEYRPYGQQKGYWEEVDALTGVVKRVLTYYEALKEILRLNKAHNGINITIDEIRSELCALLKKKLDYPHPDVDRSDVLMAYRINVGIQHQVQALGYSLGVIPYPGFLDRLNPFNKRRNGEKISSLIEVVKDLRKKFPAGLEIMEAHDKFNLAANSAFNESSILVVRAGQSYKGLSALSPAKLKLLRQLIAGGKDLVKASENEKIRYLASYFDLVPKIPTKMTFYCQGDF